MTAACKKAPGWSALACAAVLLTFCLAIAIYAPQELGMDGQLSPGVALAPPSAALYFLSHDVHPPLYYAALKAWLTIAGAGLAQTRWLSLACGCLAEATLFAMGRGVLSVKAAAIAVVLLAVCPAVFSEAATSRDYAPGLWLSLLALWLTILLVRKASPVRLVCAVLVNALALLTWYFHLLFLPAELAIAVSRRRGRAAVATSLALGIALNGPWLALAVPNILARTGAGRTFSGPHQLPSPNALLGELVQLGLGLLPARLASTGPAVAGILWLALAAAGLVLLARSRVWAQTTLVLLAGAVTGLLGFVFLHWFWATDASGRYLLAALPFVVLAQAAVLARAQGRVSGALAACWVLMTAVCGLWEFWRVHTLPPIPWSQDPVMRYVTQTASPGDMVLLSDWAAQGRYDLIDPKPGLTVLTLQTLSPAQGADVPAQLAPVVDQMRRAGRIWFVDSDIGNLPYVDAVENTLERNFYFVAQKPIPSPIFNETVLVREYAPAPAPVVRTSEALFDGKVQLASLAVAPSVRAGQVVPIDLIWKELAKLDQNYSIFIHMVNSAGQMVSQQDGWPAAGLRPTTEWQPGQTIEDRRAIDVPTNTPPGQYRLIAGIYTGDIRLRLADGSDSLVLGVVDVTPAAGNSGN